MYRTNGVFVSDFDLFQMCISISTHVSKLLSCSSNRLIHVSYMQKTIQFLFRNIN